jgi:superfamily II DNA helicase RecQ
MRDLFIDASTSVFGKHPYDWQSDVASYVGDNYQSSTNSTLLLVKPTGGGKSLVRDGIAVVLGGITLTIVPLLSLGADQTRKLNARAAQDDAPTMAFHLDEMKSPQEQQRLADRLLLLPDDTTKTILLFSSPQFLQKSPILLPALKQLVTNKLLRLLAIDEIHLFVHFGLSFRSEFAWLKDNLFHHVLAPTPLSTRIPVLLMTATCTRRIQRDMEALTGLTVSKRFWPSPLGMQHRSVR